jgi:hypothetical protein
MSMSGDACSCNSGHLANQPSDSTLGPNVDASVLPPAPGDFTAWQPILLPMEPTLWQAGYGNHTVRYQVAGSNVVWPSAMPPSQFLVPYSATWEPATAFPTMATLNGLPIANPLSNGVEMAGVHYALPTYDPSCCSCCGYPCMASGTGAL